MIPPFCLPVGKWEANRGDEAPENKIMKTTKEVVEQSNIDPSLVRSVIRQLGGKESLEDICNHGADAGYCGFTYYSDTVSFFKRNRGAITGLVESEAKDFGNSAIDLVAGFRCLSPSDDETKRSIARCLYGGRLTEEDTQVANALAWFAAEEVARAFCDC